MKIGRLLFVVIVLFTTGLWSQTTDLMRVEYMNLPFSKSGNDIQRYRALVQAPIPLDKDKKRIFVVGLEYRYIDINIKDEEDISAFNGRSINSAQEMSAYLGYVWKHNEDWRFGVKAGTRIESDLEGRLVSDDFIYEVGAYAIKDKKKNPEEGKKPYRLIVGLTYSNTPGRWYPLPIINYFKQFETNWTYTLGVPKTNIRHYLNSNHKDAFQAFATLDNVFSNIQNGFVPISVTDNPDNKKAESIQETIILLGLGYEHFFTEHLVLYVYGAHSVYNHFRLDDEKGKEVYKINVDNSPYFRAGIKFKY